MASNLPLLEAAAAKLKHLLSGDSISQRRIPLSTERLRKMALLHTLVLRVKMG